MKYRHSCSLRTISSHHGQAGRILPRFYHAEPNGLFPRIIRHEWLTHLANCRIHLVLMATLVVMLIDSLARLLWPITGIVSIHAKTHVVPNRESTSKIKKKHC